MTTLLKKFIPRTKFPNYRVALTDFKGHHAKALAKLDQIAPQLDLVFELRDARAPISTKNVLLDRSLSHKPKIILYSKKDLAKSDIKLLNKWHKDEKFMLISCKSRSDATKIIDIAKLHYQQMNPPPPLGMRMIITGMPNVGKSTLVNTLRAVGMGSTAKVAQTGGQPGITRATSNIIRICEEPPILLYDTPGVFLPRVENSQRMIVLSLVGAVSTHIVDPVIQADYLLFLCNLQNPNLYSRYLKHPSNDVYTLLSKVAKRNNMYNYRLKSYDEKNAAIHFVQMFRNGKLGGKVKFDVETIVKDDIFNYQKYNKQETQRLEEMDIVLNRAKPKDRNTEEDKIARRVNKLF